MPTSLRAGKAIGRTINRTLITIPTPILTKSRRSGIKRSRRAVTARRDNAVALMRVHGAPRIA
jgi:hypothetical protein